MFGSWRLWRYLGCGVCFITAVILFEHALTRKETSPADVVPESPDLSPFSRTKSAYEVTSKEEQIFDGVSKEIHKVVGWQNMFVELVDCNLVRWIKDVPFTRLTRNTRNFAQDDSFAHSARIGYKHRVVFFCYNFTGIDDPFTRASFAQRAHSKLFRRAHAADLLIVITRDFHPTPYIKTQLQLFASDFREMIHMHVADDSLNYPVEMIQCTKMSFVGMPFGFKLSIGSVREAMFVMPCFPEWLSKDERESCYQPSSKTQMVKALFLSDSHRMRYETLNATEPCFNFAVPFEYAERETTYPASLPFYVEDGVSAYSNDRDLSVYTVRGHWLDASVVSIMGFLGLSIWLLTHMPRADSLLEILCAISGSGVGLQGVRGRIAVAIYLWILGNTILSLAFIADMSSTMTVPSSSRITHLPRCAPKYLTKNSGVVYAGIVPMDFWAKIYRLGNLARYPGSAKTIMCGSRSEADGINRFFGFRSFRRIRLDDHGRQWIVRPRVPVNIACPSHMDGFSSKCEIVRSFVNLSEWNDYALVMLRFGLSEAPVRKQSTSSLSDLKESIGRNRGRFEKETNAQAEILRYLSQYSEERSAVDLGQSILPDAFVYSALFVLAGCSVAELLIVGRTVLPRFMNYAITSVKRIIDLVWY